MFQVPAWQHTYYNIYYNIIDCIPYNELLYPDDYFVTTNLYSFF